MMRRVGGAGPSLHVRRLLLPWTPSARTPFPTICGARRGFLWSSRTSNAQKEKVAVNVTMYDKSRFHYAGKMFGVPADTVVYYLKINLGVALVCVLVWGFFKGYAYLAHFSLATVGKLGFLGGFFTCAVMYSLALAMRARTQISPNAVYNQAIALVMKNPDVVAHLGAAPRTGEFRAYCGSGGFKFPLPRRLRSGQYELADLFGTKPRRLQMMFVLRAVGEKEGLVSCDVRRQAAGLHSTNYFHSLSIHLTGPGLEPQTIILIGREEDVVYKGLLKF